MNWLDMQRQYLDALESFGVNAFEQKKPDVFSGDQWMRAMEHWWKNNQYGLSGMNLSTFQKMVDESRNFYLLGEQLTRLLDQVNTAKSTHDEWLSSLNEQIDQLKSYFQQQGLFSTLPFTATSPNVAIDNPFIEMMQKSFNSADLSLSNFDFKGFEGFGPEWTNSLDSLFKMQPLGYSRELQEKLQKNVLLYKEYQVSNQAYNEAMMGVTLEALEKLKTELTKKAEGGEKIESLKQLYDLWVDCNEDCYADFTLTEEYSKLYGEMVNSLMAFRSQSNELMDEFMTKMNLPTKKDLSALVEQQHRMTQRLRKAEKATREYQTNIETLERKIIELQTQLTTQENTSGKSAKTSTATSKAKTKKKARKKILAKEKVVDIKSAGKKKKRAKSKSSSSDKKIEIKF